MSKHRNPAMRQERLLELRGKWTAWVEQHMSAGNIEEANKWREAIDEIDQIFAKRKEAYSRDGGSPEHMQMMRNRKRRT